MNNLQTDGQPTFDIHGMHTRIIWRDNACNESLILPSGEAVFIFVAWQMGTKVIIVHRPHSELFYSCQVVTTLRNSKAKSDQ